MGFRLGNQIAWQEDHGVNGVWKLIANPEQGQCSIFSEPFGSMKSRMGPFLFNLTADPTEETDLCAVVPERCAAMKDAMDKFKVSVDNSRVSESQCQKDLTPSPPPPAPTGGFALPTADGRCLTVQQLVQHGVLEVDSCDEGSRWNDDNGYLTNVAMDSPAYCLKLDKMGHEDACVEGATVWLGACSKGDPGFHIDQQGHLVTASCPGMCGVPASEDIRGYYTSGAVALGSCSSEAFAFQRAQLEFV